MTAGGVNLGAHLRQRDGQPIDVDFARVMLERRTAPGDAQTVSFAIASPPAGDYLLEFDSVSGRVGWFEMNGSPTATVPNQRPLTPTRPSHHEEYAAQCSAENALENVSVLLKACECCSRTIYRH